MAKVYVRRIGILLLAIAGGWGVGYFLPLVVAVVVVVWVIGFQLFLFYIIKNNTKDIL